MKGGVRVVAVLVCVQVCLSPSRGSIFIESDLLTDNWIKRLYDDKMQGYDREARPVEDHTHNTTLHLALSLNHVDLDDKRQELSVSAWSIMTWTDENLRWVPKEYMNIERLHFDDKDIWMPDIKVYNSADGSNAHPFDVVPVLVDSRGQVYWFPPTHFTVKCDLDLTNWPSDQHECMVRMGSWTHHGEQIDIQIMTINDTDGVMLTNLEKNNRWQLVKVEATRSVISLEGHDPYIEVVFAFQVKRQASTHAQYITQATLAVVVVVLASYFLALTSFFSRLVMHLFALGVLITCYFTLFTSLPSNGGPIPLVVRYFSGTIILTTISLLSTILLTSRSCCSSPLSPSSSSGLGKRLAGAVNSSRNIMPQVRSSAPYISLETEMVIDEDEGVVGSTPPPLAIQVEAQSVDGGMTISRVSQIINVFLLVLFAVAFMVDYLVLKSVAS